jgi:predicted protein tyrosine phosphatase
MKVMFVSSKDLQQLVDSWYNRFIVIQITDPGSSHVDIERNGNTADILRQEFGDCNPDGDVPAMSPYQAKDIVEFVERHKGLDVIVQCPAGQSRSRGVAAALAKIHNGDDMAYFKGQTSPNMHCYRSIMGWALAGTSD